MAFPTTVLHCDAQEAPAAIGQCLSRGWPVVVTGLVHAWPAYTRWEPDYLRRLIGEKVVTAWYLGDNVVRSDSDRGFRFLTAKRRVASLIDEFVVDDRPQKPFYLAQKSIRCGRAGDTPEIPELGADIDEPAFFSGRRKLVDANIWMSGSGPATSLHYDYCDNFLAMIRGTKRIVLFPPSETRHLDPYPCSSDTPHMSRLDMGRPDVDRFPGARRARAIELSLEPGEMLFLPAFWWHYVQSFGLNIAVNFWYEIPLATYARLLANRSALYYARFGLYRGLIGPLRNLAARVKRKEASS